MARNNFDARLSQHSVFAFCVRLALPRVVSPQKQKSCTAKKHLGFHFGRLASTPRACARTAPSRFSLEPCTKLSVALRHLSLLLLTHPHSKGPLFGLSACSPLSFPLSPCPATSRPPSPLPSCHTSPARVCALPSSNDQHQLKNTPQPPSSSSSTTLTQ